MCVMKKLSEARVTAATVARDRLGELITRVEYTDQPHLITKNGKTAVALIPAHWLERLGYSPNTGQPVD